MKLSLFSITIVTIFVFGTGGVRAEATKETKASFAQKLRADFENLGQFEKVAAEARAAGVSDQALLEAKLIFCFKSGTVDSFADLFSKFEALKEWKGEDSPFFKERFQLDAVLHMAKGILAAHRDDAATFEREMKDAFWTDPTLAASVAERVMAFRDTQMIRKVVMPMDLVFTTSKGEKTTLAELAKDQKALLIDFWASWCSPCMALMGELRQRAEQLGPQGIRVVGMNTEGDLGVAEKVRTDKKMTVAWLVEPAEHPLTHLLKVDSIPRTVLVTPDGKISFSGHPNDPELEAALSAFGISPKSPRVSKE
ncbi:MAG: TlpA family protein disulfide reductase [Verrucomicrobiota bacterium]|nr:TlpA family protein disulfide reductase [Verrucomicrobiota bacterium]